MNNLTKRNFSFKAEGENISKLEKADILELTVRHLHRLHKPRDPIEDAQRFQAGFGRCAAEACQFLLSLPGIDTRVGQNLVRHLGACATSVLPLSIQVPNQTRPGFSPPLSPVTPAGTRTQVSQAYNQDVLSSTPTIQDLSKPMTGLLMQVPKRDGSTGQSARGVLRNIILERQSKAAKKHELKQNKFSKEENCDSDMEIDIENVDDKDMWRPW